MNTLAINSQTSENSKNSLQIKWFASTQIEINGKNIYALILIPKKGEEIKHIYFRELITVDIYEKILNECNKNWKSKQSRNLQFQIAEKNQNNIEILQHAHISKKVTDFNSLNKTQRKTQERLNALLQEKNNIESEIWKYKTQISQIQEQKSEKNIEQLYSKKCYIYQNTKWSKILVILKDDGTLFDCFWITDYQKPICTIQKKQIEKKLENSSQFFNNFLRILETPINMEKMRNIVKHGVSIKSKSKNIIKFPIPEENKIISFSWSYKNSKGEKIYLDIVEWKIINATYSDKSTVSHQQKSAIQRLLNQRKFSKFQRNNIEMLKTKKYKKLKDDCELFLWSIKQSNGDKDIEETFSIEFIHHLKSHFEVSNIKQVLHKTHPDKAKNSEEKSLFTDITQIITSKLKYFKQLEKNNI